jgi:hypothetical protein
MFKRRTLSVLMLLCLAACGSLDIKDVDGNGPEDVARRFVEFARAGNFAGAASCWQAGDTTNIEANRNQSFAQFCDYFRSESYTLRYEGWDKGYCWIRFFGTDSGKTRAQILYLAPPNKSKDGRWKLTESRWIKEENR